MSCPNPAKEALAHSTSAVACPLLPFALLSLCPSLCFCLLLCFCFYRGWVLPLLPPPLPSSLFPPSFPVPLLPSPSSPIPSPLSPPPPLSLTPYFTAHPTPAPSLLPLKQQPGPDGPWPSTAISVLPKVASNGGVHIRASQGQPHGCQLIRAKDRGYGDLEDVAPLAASSGGWGHGGHALQYAAGH